MGGSGALQGGVNGNPGDVASLNMEITGNRGYAKGAGGTTSFATHFEPLARVTPFLLFSSFPFIILALLFSRSLPVATQIWGHIAGPLPPSPLRYVPSFLSREEFSTFFSLVD